MASLGTARQTREGQEHRSTETPDKLAISAVRFHPRRQSGRRTWADSVASFLDYPADRVGINDAPVEFHPHPARTDARGHVDHSGLLPQEILDASSRILFDRALERNRHVTVLAREVGPGGLHESFDFAQRDPSRIEVNADRSTIRRRMSQ